MILQPDGSLLGVRRLCGQNAMVCWTQIGPVVLHQHSVMESRNISGGLEFAILEMGSSKHDVINLPFPGRPGSVNQGRVLPVHRTCAAIRIRAVLVAVENLELI